MLRSPAVYSVIVHYQELALKGRNRPWFIHTLVRNLRALLAGLDVEHVRAVVGRIEVRMRSDADWDEVRTRLLRAPGIANFARATRTPLEMEAIAAAVMEGLTDLPPLSFRIAARRADKRFPIPSPEIERDLGQRVQAATGWPVDLKRPQRVIHVEALTDEAFVYLAKDKGTGGLPTGSSGKVLCLLSGGIDSPVAAWRLIRRGCRAHFVHFHSYPILTRTSQDKARELVTVLTRHQARSRLYLVPFGRIQQQVVISTPPPLRIVIYRRLMTRIASRIAADIKAHALVTGDAVGQVASQTVENLARVDRVADLPILRPLIGFDKEEITAEAERLGTYAISIIPDEDCCTLFTPRAPATRARLNEVEFAETHLDIEALVNTAMGEVVMEDFKYPVIKSPA